MTLDREFLNQIAQGHLRLIPAIENLTAQVAAMRAASAESGAGERPEPPSSWSWPYQKLGSDNTEAVAFYPATLRGLTFDFVERIAVTYGGYAGDEQPIESVIGGNPAAPIKSGVFLADTDALLFLQNDAPVILPGGVPVALNLDRARSATVRMNFATEKTGPMEIGFGIMAWFSTCPTPPTLGRGNWRFQRNQTSGGTKSMAKVAAAGTADPWAIPTMAPIYGSTPQLETNFYTVTESSALTSWATGGIRTAHLRRKTFSIRNASSSDGPIEVRLQGVDVLGFDIDPVITDDPAIPVGVLLDPDETIKIETDLHYAEMRIMARCHEDVAADDAANVAFEMAGSFM